MIEDGSLASARLPPRRRPDRRTGERWTAPQWLKNTILLALLRALLWIVDRVPASLLVVLGRLVGRAALLLCSAARRKAHDNLRRCFDPRESRRLARRCFIRAGENLALCLLLRRKAIRASDWVRLPAKSAEVLRSALAEGRGAVFVSAHLGPFEMIPAVVREHGIVPGIVVRESYDPRLDHAVDLHRNLRGIEVIHRGRAGAAFRIARALRHGKPLGFLPDLGGRVPGHPVEFLGTRCELALGPQRIARRCGSPLVVGTLSRLDTVGSGPPFELQIRALPLDDHEARLTQCVSDELSDRILAHPEDWLWMARDLAPLPADLPRS